MGATVNRRNFFKRAAQVVAAVVVAPAVIEKIAEVSAAPIAYRTYIMGKDAFLNR